MPKCAFCGTETVLHMNGVPTCISCDLKELQRKPPQRERAEIRCGMCDALESIRSSRRRRYAEIEERLKLEPIMTNRLSTEWNAIAVELAQSEARIIEHRKMHQAPKAVAG
jgi:hypothetical protein